MAYQPVVPSAPGRGPMAGQIQGLLARGMAVPDVDFAAHCLAHIGYYRLMHYWSPFQSGHNPTAHFQPGTSFSHVLMRYVFDQRLRSLLLEALSYVEISMRNQWSLHVVQSSSRGEFAHLDASLFDSKYHAGNLRELERDYNRVRKPGRTRFHSVRIWDIVPTMPFGSLSKWYSSLAHRSDRQSISRIYGVDEATLKSILRHLTSVRNACAHHEPIWDENIRTGLRMPQRLSGATDITMAFNKSAGRKLYNALVVIIYLIEVIAPNGDWPERLLALLAAYSSVPYDRMGFPSGWREFTIWKKHLPQVG